MITLAVFAVLLIVGFFVYFDVYLKQPPIQGLAIRNGKDEHGCLVRSGYKWDNSSQACIKESANKTMIYQVFDFESCLNAGYAINENNKTKKLQCQTLNGTLFINNSPKISANLSKETNTTNYPDNVFLMSNFSIAGLFGK